MVFDQGSEASALLWPFPFPNFCAFTFLPTPEVFKSFCLLLFHESPFVKINVLNLFCCVIEQGTIFSCHAGTLRQQSPFALSDSQTKHIANGRCHKGFVLLCHKSTDSQLDLKSTVLILPDASCTAHRLVPSVEPQMPRKRSACKSLGLVDTHTVRIISGS